MTIYQSLLAFGFSALGGLSGAVHFALLLRSAVAIAHPGAKRWMMVAPAFRFALMAAVLASAAANGVVALLAALAGFLAARAVALHRIGGLCR